MTGMVIEQIRVESPDPADERDWSVLRHELWPEASIEDHRSEITQLSEHHTRAVFLCRRGGRAIGFAEASLRSDYVNGCGPGPVAFLEGIYVRPENRLQATARRLCAAVEKARDQRCRELASDVELHNQASQAVHQALGFSETERVVFYRKRF
jgi:aminoglycoside 6'-N-acetyltransferase I